MPWQPGCNDPHVDARRLRAAEAQDFPLLQHPQQPGLQGQRHVADLVEKQGATVRRFEETRLAAATSVSEGSLLVAEELAFEETFCKGAAVDGDERTGSARAVVVDSLSEEFLAGSTFTGDQNGRARPGRFAYFDNTYMYPQDDRLLTEETPFEPAGRKGAVRAAMASMVLQEMARGDIPVLIGRAPEFYGPGKTQSFTNALIIDNLRIGKRPRVPVRDDTRRTLVWTPDASRALATLANTPDAYGQTWHLPCCDDRLTYRQFVAVASDVFGAEDAYKIVGKWTLIAAGIFSKQVREIWELLPRYEQDNLFDSTKFKRRFPAFVVTSYRTGLSRIRRECAPAP